MFNIEGARWFMHNLVVPGNMPGRRMMEFGDQTIWEHARRMFKIDFEVAKDWFVSMGVDHVSIDLNGQHGALPFDLAKPIEMKEYMGAFDYVTNIGTLEHIEPLEGQYECLRNMHNFCKVGGLMVHQLPPNGQWMDHCRFRYGVPFINTLAELNDYFGVNVERVNLASLGGHVDYWCVLYRKTVDRSFTDQKATLLATIGVDEQLKVANA